MTKRRMKPGNALTAIAYLRVSTDDQRLGPEAQRAQIEAWAARAGVEILSWQSDTGVSGASELDDRLGLAAALGELRANRAGVLVVAKRDRLARDVGVAIAIERAVTACGAVVVSADGAGNGSSPADKFMRTIMDAAAEYERALIALRTKQALAAKRARGERAGAVPFGFTADAAGKLSPCASEQATVARVLNLRRVKHTLRAVTATLAAEGHVGRAGEPLSLTQVARIERVAATLAAAAVTA